MNDNKSSNFAEYLNYLETEDNLPKLYAALDQLKKPFKSSGIMLMFFTPIDQLLYYAVLFISLTNIINTFFNKAIGSESILWKIINFSPTFTDDFWNAIIWLVIAVFGPFIFTLIAGQIIKSSINKHSFDNKTIETNNENVTATETLNKVKSIEKQTQSGCLLALSVILGIALSVTYIILAETTFLYSLLIAVLLLFGVFWGCSHLYSLDPLAENTGKVLKEIKTKLQKIIDNEVAAKKEAERKRIEEENRRELEELERLEKEDYRRNWEKNKAKSEALYTEAISQDKIDLSKLNEAAELGHHDAAIKLAETCIEKANSGEYTKSEKRDLYKKALHALECLNIHSTDSATSKYLYLKLTTLLGVPRDEYVEILHTLRDLKDNNELDAEYIDDCKEYIIDMVNTLNDLEQPSYSSSTTYDRSLSYNEMQDYIDKNCNGIYSQYGIDRIENDYNLTSSQKEELRRHLRIYGD